MPSPVRTNPVALLLTSALAAGTLLLAACGGSTPAAPTATTAAPKATETAAPAATTPAAPKASATAAAATGSTGAAAATTVKLAKVDGKDVLVDARGMTLYIFKNDVAGNGKSVCNGGCATNWPPLKAPDAAPSKGAGVTGDLSVVTRDDGTKQIAYKGLPLYFFQADQAVGDAKGAAIANWALALP
jgi:predicted lipoprotein with Yx(FWY)xxD motif